jgi:hypothetical protein
MKTMALPEFRQKAELRYERVRQMRAEGKTYDEIAVKLGVSRGRAAQIVKRANETAQIGQGPFANLPRRIVNILESAGLKNWKAVSKAVVLGRPDLTKVRNCGVEAISFIQNEVIERAARE